MSAARYAQHFLTSPDAIQRIIDSLELKGQDYVLEIGPGKGALTGPLIQTGARIFSVEIDKFMVDILKEKIPSSNNFTLIQADFLEFHLGQLPRPPNGELFKVVGNLPYNITSPILRKLSQWSGWNFAVLMVQKEVGQRICAEPGTSDYGALTVGVNLTCQAEHIFDLSETSFRPKPKVASSVLKITRREKPLTDNVLQTQRVIQAAFQQRRKTILNSLSHGLNLEKEPVGFVLKKLGIDPQLRAENLTVDQFILLTNNLFEK